LQAEGPKGGYRVRHDLGTVGAVGRKDKAASVRRAVEVVKRAQNHLETVPPIVEGLPQLDHVGACDHARFVIDVGPAELPGTKDPHRVRDGPDGQADVVGRSSENRSVQRRDDLVEPEHEACPVSPGGTVAGSTGPAGQHVLPAGFGGSWGLGGATARTVARTEEGTQAGGVLLDGARAASTLDEVLFKVEEVDGGRRHAKEATSRRKRGKPIRAGFLNTGIKA